MRLTLPTLRHDGTARLTVPYVTTNKGEGTQGLGDVELRFNYVHFSKGKWGAAIGLESTLDTAQASNLGLGFNTLAPIVAIPYTLSEQWRFEPTMKFKAALGSDYNKFHKSIIELNFNWKAVNNKYWAQIEPKIDIDHVKNKTAIAIELEAGKQIGKNHTGGGIGRRIH